MQYLLLLHADEAGWDAMDPATQSAAMAAYGAFGEALTKAGALVNASRLTPSAAARTITTKGGRPVTMDGPFAETKEQVTGFYLIEAADDAAAADWAARCPTAQHGAVEVRKLWS